eukprot:646927-Prorocentrum_minimum.AAC.4
MPEPKPIYCTDAPIYIHTAIKPSLGHSTDEKFGSPPKYSQTPKNCQKCELSTKPLRCHLRFNNWRIGFAP